MDTIEKRRHATHLQQYYEQHRSGQAELLTVLDQLKALQANPKQICILSDAMLQSWIVNI